MLALLTLHFLGSFCYGTEVFEWAGIFETPEDTYLWTAQKVETSMGIRYVDAAMKMVAIPVQAATEAQLHADESQGDSVMEQTCTNVAANGIITPDRNQCYNLVFRNDWWQSLYTINTAGVAAVAFYAQHLPTEFENTAHYLKDNNGTDIEPVAEIDRTATSTGVEAIIEEEDKHYGLAMLTGGIVNLTTLIGVILLVPGISMAARTYAEAFECMLAGFAAGAISACAFLLLLFESTHLIAVEHKEEVDVIWRWGIMILAGYLFPALLQLLPDIVFSLNPSLKPSKKKVQWNDFSTEKSTSEEELDFPTRVRLILGILVGDFLHNLCDGFFIGAAFRTCQTNKGWAVAGGTILHELAQEISDYAILVGPGARLSPAVALILNFISGTSVLLGVIIVMGTDVEDVDTGLLLAFGGGTYLHIAFTECMPRVYNAKVSAATRSFATLLFIVGATAIGLVLLWHEHCVAPAAPGEAPSSGGHH